MYRMLASLTSQFLHLYNEVVRRDQQFLNLSRRLNPWKDFLTQNASLIPEFLIQKAQGEDWDLYFERVMLKLLLRTVLGEPLE